MTATSKAITIETIVARWSDPAARPLFKGRLIDEERCCCAQGDVLRLCGWTDDKLRGTDQIRADRAVAEALGISTAHAVLLRIVNDRKDGCPQDVLTHPERVLGDQAPRVLAFWRLVDGMTPAAWEAVEKAAVGAVRADARTAAWKTAMGAARTAARTAAGEATVEAAWKASRAGVAAWATNEIQGAAHLTSFYFLPMFGITDPAELDE